MADVVTKEELNQELQNEMKEILTQTSQIVKKYIDEHSVENEDVKNALKEEITDAIAKNFNFEEEKGKIEKASQVADTLLGIFDADESGDITAEEFMNKLNEIYAKLETTNELSDELKKLAQQLSDLKTYVDNKIAEVNGAINSVKSDVSQNTQAIQSLSTNVFTKAEVEEIITVNKDEIINEVSGVFYPSADENGDGATL